MASQKNLYDPERLQKIGQILPGLCEFARPGDEITLGLEGDPEFPMAYRGARPVGVIESIDKDNDAIIVNARMEDGQVMKLPSTTIGAYNSWEFTEHGFEKVAEREEEKAARSESAIVSNVPEYRGTGNEIDDIKERLSELEQLMRKYELTQTSFRSTVVSTFKEVANDVNKLSQKNGLETKFCGSLVGRYEDIMQSRAEKSFRGSSKDEEYRGKDDDDDENSDYNNSSIVSSERSRDEKLNFSDDDVSLISDED